MFILCKSDILFRYFQVKTLFLVFYSYTILLFLIFRLLKSRPYGKF